MSLAKNFVRAICLFLGFACLTSNAFAHDPGLSSASLRLSGETITGRLIFARTDIEQLVPLDSNHDGNVTAKEFEYARPGLETLASNALEVAINNRAVPAETCLAQLEAGNGVRFDLTYGSRGTRLNISSKLISRLARGHRQYFTIHDEQNHQLGERMLDATHPGFELELTAWPVKSATLHPFRRFLILGVEHIVTGYDHLAFLFGLLLIGGAFRSALKIITSFTLAHSLTLALATFNLIRLPSGLVEPIIAASIVYVGMENIFRRNMDKRWLLTFGFGLIHGCGFASALKEAGLGTEGSSVVLPLFSFNLGVELGQLAIAAVVLPLIWKLKQAPHFAFRYAPACSILIALAGSYWLIERVVVPK